MKKINVTLISEDMSKGHGIATYCNNLIIHLKKKKVNIKSSRTKKLFGDYPVSLSSPLKTMNVHFMDQRVASILFFSLFRRYKSIVTIHDVTELINFKNINNVNTMKAKILYNVWNWIIKRSLKKADAIITVSEHTKKDVCALIGYDKKIYVTYEAADKEFKPQKVKKSSNSILYVGVNLIHKNLKTLLQAFSLVRKKLPQSKLIFVGNMLPSGERLQTLIKRLNLKKSIIFKGYVKDISEEYSRASVFVFPSLYEGFGLPVLEAMACGCPVICSNATSLPEVGGNAVLYFNPNNPEELSEKMYKVLTDGKLRENLVKKGLKRAKQFTWEKTAQETIQVYKKVFKSSKK